METRAIRKEEREIRKGKGAHLPFYTDEEWNLVQRKRAIQALTDEQDEKLVRAARESRARYLRGKLATHTIDGDEQRELEALQAVEWTAAAAQLDREFAANRAQGGCGKVASRPRTVRDIPEAWELVQGDNVEAIFDHLGAPTEARDFGCLFVEMLEGDYGQVYGTRSAVPVLDFIVEDIRALVAELRNDEGEDIDDEEMNTEIRERLSDEDRAWNERENYRPDGEGESDAERNI